ncbi:hypothetical protein B0H17DRAFT_1209336 [Mycena rosella]|uniref:Uncharacterized protein n=1 Tax=Mycena rosella TaxID=1033263 RepID=A0AAD7CYX6_MYCRO|nr:hypothetical protein B0H17DRAFT_1209336 [Mycena rosella]
MSLSEASGNNMSASVPLSPPRHFPAPLAGQTRTLPSLKDSDAAAFQASLSRLKDACGQEYIPPVDRKLAAKPPNSVEASKVQEFKPIVPRIKTPLYPTLVYVGLKNIATDPDPSCTLQMSIDHLLAFCKAPASSTFANHCNWVKNATQTVQLLQNAS